VLGKLVGLLPPNSHRNCIALIGSFGNPCFGILFWIFKVDFEGLRFGGPAGGY
jgi:hypothetical protein